MAAGGSNFATVARVESGKLFIKAVRNRDRNVIAIHYKLTLTDKTLRDAWKGRTEWIFQFKEINEDNFITRTKEFKRQQIHEMAKAFGFYRSQLAFDSKMDGDSILYVSAPRHPNRRFRGALSTASAAETLCAFLYKA